MKFLQVFALMFLHAKCVAKFNGVLRKKMTFSALNLAIVALNFAIIAKFNIAIFNATPDLYKGNHTELVIHEALYD